MLFQIGTKEVIVRLKIKDIKNIYLRIEKGEIVISCNKRLHTDKIKEILDKHKNWIQTQITNYEQNNCQANEILLFGKIYQLNYNDQNEKYQIINNVINVKENLVSVLVREAHQKVEELFRSIEKQLGYHNIELKFSKLKTKWGICYFKQHKIVLNQAIYQLPIHLIKYIVFHEFTHFEVNNHSNYFYQKLALKCREYKKHKVELRKYNCIL